MYCIYVYIYTKYAGGQHCVYLFACMHIYIYVNLFTLFIYFISVCICIYACVKRCFLVIYTGANLFTLFILCMCICI